MTQITTSIYHRVLLVNDKSSVREMMKLRSYKLIEGLIVRLREPSIPGEESDSVYSPTAVLMARSDVCMDSYTNVVRKPAVERSYSHHRNRSAETPNAPMPSAKGLCQQV